MSKAPVATPIHVDLNWTCNISQEVIQRGGQTFNKSQLTYCGRHGHAPKSQVGWKPMGHHRSIKIDLDMSIWSIDASDAGRGSWNTPAEKYFCTANIFASSSLRLSHGPTNTIWSGTLFELAGSTYYAQNAMSPSLAAKPRSGFAIAAMNTTQKKIGSTTNDEVTVQGRFGSDIPAR
jgi:hypothetical protein